MSINSKWDLLLIKKEVCLTYEVDPPGARTPQKRHMANPDFDKGQKLNQRCESTQLPGPVRVD